MRFTFGHHPGQRHSGPRRGGGHWGGGRGGRHGFSPDFEDEEGGRRRRVFDGGELRLVLLKLIGDEPRHGYDLIRAIEELTGGAYAPSPGVVYPTVTLLGEMDLIEEQSAQGARKIFAITDAGRAHLAEHQAKLDALFARLAGLAEIRGRMDALPVKRALHNLRNVLRHRLTQQDIEKEKVHEIVAAIDELAGRIERM